MNGAYYNEIDPYAAQWLRNLIAAGHIAPGDVDERSIVEVRPDDLRGYVQCHFFAGIGVWSHALRSAGWADDRPVWTGSCPCQPFSAAGKGDEFGDERHLWPVWFRLIRECGPVAVFGEQVASKDALAWLDHVSTDLEGEGYTFGAVDTCAAGFGAPHIRQRLYFVADRDGSRCGARWTGEAGDGRGSARFEPSGLRPAGELADNGSIGRKRNPETEGLARQDAAERREGLSDPEPRSVPCDVGCAAGRGLGIERDAPQPRRSGHADGAEQHGVALGDTIEHGLEGHRRHGDDRDEPGRIGENKARPVTAAGGDGGISHTDDQGPPLAGVKQELRHNEFGNADGKAGPTNGRWAAAEWLPCRDGKARPTEPGTFPLAHGATSRVGRLRAYGNAINAAQAEEFIRAYQGVSAE